MIQGQVTIIAAIRDFFNDRKLEISELKNLTYQDRVEFREMLIAEGYDIAPLMGPTPPQES